jgi:hypothetical protein
MSKKKELKLGVSDDNLIILSDGNGGIVIKNAAGASITVSSEGIVLDSGQGAKLTLKGPKVDVNDGALEVI